MIEIEQTVPQVIELELAFEHRVAGDPDDRTSWVKVLPVGEIHNGGRAVTVTLEYIEEVAANTRRALYAFEQYAKDAGQTPYRFPVLAVHKDEGKRYGELLDVKVSTDAAGEQALYNKICWSPATWAAIQAEEVQHISPKIMSGYQDGRGVAYGRLQVELSITGEPAQEYIGRIQDTLDLELSKQQGQQPMTEEEKKQLEDLRQLIADQAKKLEDQAQEIADLKAGSGGEGDPPAGDPPPAAKEGGEDGEGKEGEEEDEQKVEASKVAGQVVELIAPKLGELISSKVEQALSKSGLNLGEQGQSGNPPTGGALTIDLALSKARDEGLKGTAAAQRAQELMGH